MPKYSEQVIYYIICDFCRCKTDNFRKESIAADVWNRRAPEIVKVETNFYDKEEIYPDCTVQVLTNTATGEVSVGWWKNGEKAEHL